MHHHRIRQGGVAATLLAMIINLVGCASTPSYPLPSDRFFVNDTANIISETDEQTIVAAGQQLQAATGAQVVLLTVADIGNKSPEDYALTIARNWGLGDKEKNNGILLLFITDRPRSRIEVGYGLEGAIPDSKAGRILDGYLVPHYNNRDAWSTALTTTYRTIINEVYAEYGMADSQPIPDAADEDTQTTGSVFLLIPLLLMLAVILSAGRGGIFLLPHIGGFRGGGGFGGGFRGGGGGFGGGGASR